MPPGYSQRHQRQHPACASSKLRPVGVSGCAVPPKLSVGQLTGPSSSRGGPSPAQRGYGRLQFPAAVHQMEEAPSREKPGWQL